MKKILLSIFTLIILGLTTKVQAQCSVTDAAIEINSSTAGTSPNTCVINFDLQFKLQFNGGNKIVVIQAWLADSYPNYWQNGAKACDDTKKAPKAADLKKNGTGLLPFLNLAFDNTVSPPTPITSYGPDATVPLITGYTILRGATDANGYQLITLQNVTVTVPAECGSGVSIKADLWSSQGSINSQWTPHCVNCNNLYAFNYPEVSAEIQCQEPRRYVTTVDNINTSGDITFTWKAYRDDFPFGGSRNSEDNILVDEMTTPRTLSPGDTYNESRTYLGNETPPTANQNIWVEVFTVGLPNTQLALALPESGCIPLPVKLKSFTASRKQSNVELKWTTTLEQNNSGFELQRQSGAGGWQKIAFVNSKATDGNSVSDLHYNHSDANDSRGVSQYRLMQIDLDDNAKYSEIRSVQGIGQEARTIISPNPSANGRVNVTFQSASAKRDLQLTDMHGRMLKQWNAYGDNSLQITDLTPGIYQLRIVDRETGTQTVEKIMVVNR